MHTLTGKTQDEVAQKLKEILPPAAYKKVGGSGANLTDTNPAYLMEVLNELFGLVGWGWFYDYDSEDIEIIPGDKQTEVIIKRFRLYYKFDEDGKVHISSPIIAGAGSKNKNVGDAMKGAVTNGIGKAASVLGWQIGVYKGILNHTNAGAFFKKQNEPNESDREDPEPEKPKLEIVEKAGDVIDEALQEVDAIIESLEPEEAPAVEEGEKVVDQETGEVKPERPPMAPEEIRDVIKRKIEKLGDNLQISDGFRGFTRGLLGHALADRDELVSMFNYLLGNPDREIKGSADLSDTEIKALHAWIAVREVAGKDVPSIVMVIEARSIVERMVATSG